MWTVNGMVFVTLCVQYLDVNGMVSVSLCAQSFDVNGAVFFTVRSQCEWYGNLNNVLFWRITVVVGICTPCEIFVCFITILCCCWSLLYSAILHSHSRLGAFLLHVILNEWLAFGNRFWISTEVVYLQRCLVVTWLVPRETAAVSAHVLWPPYNHAPCHVTSCKTTYMRCMHV